MRLHYIIYNITCLYTNDIHTDTQSQAHGFFIDFID